MKKRINGFPFREDRLKQLDEQGDYQDSNLSGFGIRVTATKKVFQVRRKRNNRYIRVKIGEYPTMNLRSAKEKALTVLTDIEKGINPNEQRKEDANKEVTLEQAYQSYVDSRDLKEKTLIGYKQVINCYLDDWKDKALYKLTEDEITHLHKQVSTRSKAQADLMARVLRAIFNYAKYEYRGIDNVYLFPDNPVKILSHKNQWNKVERKTTRIRQTQLKEYLEAVNNVKSNLMYDDFTRSVCEAVEFALFTGLRKYEVLNIEWEKVDLQDKYFWIDETKNGERLELPITETLSKIFKRCWANRDESGRYVFTGIKSGEPIKEPRYVLKKINNEIESENLKKLNITWHDLRRTYGTIAESTNVGAYTLKRLLNHRTKRSDDVTAGYVILDADELREPAESIEQTILESAGLIEPKQGIDAKLEGLLKGISDEEKRALIFSISHNKEKTNE